MTRLIEFLISLAIVVVVFVGVGFLLPSSRHFEHSVETNRKMTIVYDTINSLRRFPAWNILVAKDPNMDLELVGPEEGVGARLEYSSEERGIGEGAWEIV
ncbi:polyketide cyclase, partial [Lysobacter sp. D1-1-M9]